MRAAAPYPYPNLNPYPNPTATQPYRYPTLPLPTLPLPNSTPNPDSLSALGNVINALAEQAKKSKKVDTPLARNLRLPHNPDLPTPPPTPTPTSTLTALPQGVAVREAQS